MRQDVRLHKYYYGCSRGSSVLLIVRVAQVSYLCHYYDYDLHLGSINIYPPCLILNLVYITSPQQPNDGRPLFSASLARPRSPHRTLRRPGRSRRGCDRAGRTESSSARFGQLSTSSINSLCQSAGCAAHVSPHLLVPSEGQVADVADAFELPGLKVGHQGLFLPRQGPPSR